MIVLSTDPTADISVHSKATGLEGMVDIRQVPYSLERLEKEAAQILKTGPTRPFDLTVDVINNRVLLEVASSPDFEAFLLLHRVALPETAHVVVVDELAWPAANIYGGVALTSCTSGFSVQNGSGTKGIVTAGHCSNSQSYSGTSLPFQGEAFFGSNDEQWHTAPGFTVKNWAHDGQWDTSTPYYRVITSTTHRDNQPLNSFYCKYGMSTYYGCGYLISKTRAPGYVPNVNPTFMELHRDGVNLCLGGDSGGPVYTSSSALGIISGCAGSGGINNIFYTAINYVSSGLGVTVLTS